MENKQKIRVSLLQPGVFIELGGQWISHPFLFSKFKVKTWKQIEMLEKSGIKEVLWVPEKSDCLPKTAGDVRAPETPVAVEDVEEDPNVLAMWQVKKEQIERLKNIHNSLRQCTQNYNRISENIPGLMNQMMAGSLDAVTSAREIMGGIVDGLLDDTDAIVHLINVKEKVEALYHHALNVSVLAVMIGKKAKLPPAEMHELGLGALFHDIGKSRIEKKVLKKKGPLTRAESAVLQLHPRYGVEILTKCGIQEAGVLRILMEHHEQFGGQGYPAGLKGEKISRLARIVRIADAYDNLCNNPDPENQMTPYEALSHMYNKQQSQMDLELFSVFVGIVGIYPPGTVVKLSNGEVGIVISINPRNPLKPSLLIYDANIPKDEALICEMEENEDISIEKSIRIDEISDQMRHYLSASTHVTYFVGKGTEKRRML